jgi:arylsulfatase A-like enzyme
MNLLLVLLSALPAIAQNAPSATEPEPVRPNILIMLADDANTRCVGAMGGAEARTPHIDQLAASGVILDHAYHQGAFSGAICTVSRAMIMTGRSVWQVTPGQPYGRATSNLQTSDVLMPEFFAKKGYQSFATGKWHNGDTALLRGFEVAVAIAPGMLPYNARDHGGSRDAAIEMGQLNPKVRRLDPDTHEMVKYQAEGWSTDVYFDAAENFLRQRDQTRPFFMYVATNAPHDPRHESAEYLKRFPEQSITLPLNHRLQHPFDNGDLQVRDEIVFPVPHDSAQVLREQKFYLAMLARIDDRVGRLLGLLQERGELENTLIVFSSDHGLAMGEQGLMGKQNLYEASWRVPMVVSGPGLPKMARRSGMAYLHGIFPTLCSLAGFEPPAYTQKFDFSTVVLGTGPGQRQLVGVYTPNAKSARGIRCIRQRQWKYIHYLHNQKQQLFDLQADPLELNDLSEVPSHQGTLKALRTDLLLWMQRNSDPQTEA